MGSGGVFVLRPNVSDYKKLLKIVHDVEKRSVESPYPHWNETLGWGHVIGNSEKDNIDGGNNNTNGIVSNDYWINSKGRKGYRWDFYGVQADQGLLYYWTKYVQRSVSIIVNNRIEMWGVDPSTGRLVREVKEDEEESVAASL